MKSIMLGAALLIVGITTALASCPPGTRYDCYTTANGRQSCGCR